MFDVPVQDREAFGANDTHYWMLKAAGLGLCFGSVSCCLVRKTGLDNSQTSLVIIAITDYFN